MKAKENFKIIKTFRTKHGHLGVMVEANLVHKTFLNGYVGVNEKSRFYKIYYLQLELEMLKSGDPHFDVHRGITFSNQLDEYYENDEIKDLWFFGFDCAHASDTIEECNEEYVVREIESLSRQIYQKETENDQTKNKIQIS